MKQHLKWQLFATLPKQIIQIGPVKLELIIWLPGKQQVQKYLPLLVNLWLLYETQISLQRRHLLTAWPWMSDSQRKDSGPDIWRWFFIRSVLSRQSRNYTNVALPNFVTLDSTVLVLFPHFLWSTEVFRKSDLCWGRFGSAGVGGQIAFPNEVWFGGKLLLAGGGFLTCRSNQRCRGVSATVWLQGLDIHRGRRGLQRAHKVPDRFSFQTFPYIATEYNLTDIQVYPSF